MTFHGSILLNIKLEPTTTSSPRRRGRGWHNPDSSHDQIQCFWLAEVRNFTNIMKEYQLQTNVRDNDLLSLRILYFFCICLTLTHINGKYMFTQYSTHQARYCVSELGCNRAVSGSIHLVIARFWPIMMCFRRSELFNMSDGFKFGL